MSKETSKQVAALAAIGIKRPFDLTATEVRKVCASVLTQAEKCGALWQPDPLRPIMAICQLRPGHKGAHSTTKKKTEGKARAITPGHKD